MSVTLESLNAQILALRAEVSALSAMPKASKPRAKKATAEKDPNAPKKKATWWIEATKTVREALKPAMEAHNANLAEGAKKLPGTAPVQVSRILKEAGLLSADRIPEMTEITKAFQDFLQAPLPVKTAEWKASAANSTASESSGGKKPKAANSDLTPEEVAAAKAVRAAKGKATREAKKAKKAAEVEVPVVVPAPADDNVVEAYEWQHDIGKGLKMYERIDYKGKAYIYTEGGEAYIGVWDGKVIDKKIRDFQEE